MVGAGPVRGPVRDPGGGGYVVVGGGDPVGVSELVPVEVVDIIDSENRKLTAYIHSSTLLPVKQSFQRWDNNIKDRRDEVTRFTKYREAGNGVMWPYDVQRERDNEKLYELYAEKVVIGEELNSDLFELPPGIKIIEKKVR